MLRLLRSRPNPFSLATRVHGNVGPTPQVIQVQRVKIRRKWFKPRNILIAGCVYYVCYRAYKASILATISPWLDEQERHLTKEERKDIEEDMLEPMFFPIPFTTRAVDSPPYKSSDPEWRTFIRINKDPQLIRGVQDGLAELVCKTAMRNPVLVQRCGNEMRINRYWLTVTYPSRPPPTFVQKGISIGDEVTITEEPIDTTAAFWVRRALWPYTITVSLWSFSGELIKQNALHVARIFGYSLDSDSNPSLQQTIQEVARRISKSVDEPNPKAPNSLPPPKPQEAGGSGHPVENRPTGSSPAPESPGAPPNSGVSRPMPIISGVESNKPKSVKDIYGIENTKEHVKGPWSAFKKTFSQTWRPMPAFPPKGSILTTGLVEISTPRAYITVDATAFWDPRTETFHARSTNFRLKSIRMKMQAPSRR